MGYSTLDLYNRITISKCMQIIGIIAVLYSTSLLDKYYADICFDTSLKNIISFGKLVVRVEKYVESSIRIYRKPCKVF